MILIDTSIWIAFLSKPESKAAKQLTHFIETDEPLCINAIVQMELMMGARSDKDLSNLKKFLRPFQYFPHMDWRYFELASEIYRECRKRGLTIRKSNDCLIAANAIHDNLLVFHKDRDFNAMAKCRKDLLHINC